MRIMSTVVGLIIVMLTLRDIMHELFDPEDVGSMSRPVMRGVWRAIRALARRRSALVYHAGHIILISVAAFWTILLTVGWALVYWPQLPQGFHIDSALPPDAGRGFGTALYVSLTALTTLGSNDIVPVGTALRLAAALESLIGVGMITAWISWVLSIYPVLSARRAFEREVCLLHDVHRDVDRLVRDYDPRALTALLRSLGEQVLRVNSDLSQSRVTYYFQNRTRDVSLSRQLPYVLSLGRAAAAGRETAVRDQGYLLARAVESMLSVIGRDFLDMEVADPEAILRALAEDHLDTARHE